MCVRPATVIVTDGTELRRSESLVTLHRPVLTVVQVSAAPTLHVALTRAPETAVPSAPWPRF